MSCYQAYCHACRRDSMICEGICKCGAFHEEDHLQYEKNRPKLDEELFQEEKRAMILADSHDPQ